MYTKWDTLSGRILELTAISGELPYTALSRLKGGVEYKRKTVTALRQANLLRKFTKDKVSGYRLTASAKEILLSENEKRFAYFLNGNTETNMVRGELTRRTRLHRIADTYMLMQNAGVEIFRDIKTPVFEYLRDKIPTAYTASTVYTDVGAICYQDIIFPAFYDSKEIKEIGAALANVRGSRLIGVLLTENVLFATYHTGHTLMRWETGSEIKTRELFRQIFRRKVSGFDSENIRGLIIGDSMDMALELLESDGGAKRRYSMVDDSYGNLHFIPNNENGELILRILCNHEVWESTESMLASDFHPATVSICDAADEDGNPVLFAYVMDLKRIKNFTAWMSVHNQTGSIICFDFQRDVLTKFCGENIRLEALDAEKYRRRFVDN